MSYIVVCQEELRESSDNKVAMGPFEFRNEAQDYVDFVEGRTVPPKVSLKCFGPHFIMTLEQPLGKEARERVESEVRRLML